MIISISWLKDFVDLEGVTPEEIAELLSLHTCEVEGVETVGASIAGVVVGEVLECQPHPDADKLSVTKVAFGAEEPVPVVCGAPNVRTGLKVAFAPVGCVLPGDFKIKKAKLRGQPSLGMICSSQELELSEDHEGILELSNDASVGTRLIDHLEMADTVLEVDNKSVTHRPDLWGHYGFARELSAILNRPLRPLPILSEWPDGDSATPVTIRNEEDCGRYHALRFSLEEGTRQSSEMIARRLQAVGQRLVNDVVDLTNYVLLETGQPTHAFDVQGLPGDGVEIRRANSSEVLETLDGVERTLGADDLVIASNETAVALAGVMGGSSSEVSGDSTEFLLESASFDPVRVRRTSQRLALRSDASARFEKSLDPALCDVALRRFAFLLGENRKDLSILGPPTECGSGTAPSIELELNPERCASLLGLDLQPDQIKEYLIRLGFVVGDADASFQVSVPSWRATKDVTMAIDLVEEVGRLAGYHQVQPRALEWAMEAPHVDASRVLSRKLADRLAGPWRMAQSEGYSFLDRSWAQRLQLEDDQFVSLENPVQDRVDLVRRDLIPSLLEQMALNARECEQGSLFELGKGYEPSSGEPQERSWLGVLVWEPKGACRPDGPSSLFGKARSLGDDLLHCAGHQIQPAVPESLTQGWCHPARALEWDHAGPVMTVAALDPRLLLDLGLEGFDCVALLMDVAAVSGISSKQAKSFKSPSKMPAIKVDVALALPAAVAYSQVEGLL